MDNMTVHKHDWQEIGPLRTDQKNVLKTIQCKICLKEQIVAV